MPDTRFFIDHGMIHDRLTGKHVTTEPDSAFCDGIQSCCELLNALAEKREPRSFPLLFDADWLEEKIKRDPDIECDVGTSSSIPACTCGADPRQLPDQHDISCPMALEPSK